MGFEMVIHCTALLAVFFTTVPGAAQLSCSSSTETKLSTCHIMPFKKLGTSADLGLEEN
jgi:hypothetical protein